MAKNKSLFDWVQSNAYKIQQGLEKGIEASEKVRKTIDKKIEAHPKVKAARDVATEFVKAQAERLSDVRINGTRVGDFPNAAQKLTERQIYKLISKLREVDPDANWDQFIPNTNDMPVFGAFETLGLPYGAPFEEVKKTYRSLMREYHPDKHGDSPEEERKATQKTQELTAAYELICQHYGK